MKCIPTIPVGSNCTNEKQCMTPSTCNDSVCTCPEEYYQKDQQCEKRVLPGESCENQTSCVENAVCVSTNYTCQCRPGWMVNGSMCTPKETRYVENLKASSKTSSSVLVTFDGPLDYNKFKLDVNTSTPRCIVLRRNASQEHCSACKIEDIEPPRDKRIEYNVTGLEVFTVYEIKVAMVKCNNGSSEGSRPATVTERTDTAVPNVVNGLTTCDSCLVCAMWAPPDPYPGPVTYSVDIFDEVNMKVVKETSKNATSVCYTKEDVSPFLRYTIGVSAFTTAGQGMEKRTTSMEIHFLEIKIITAEGVCSSHSGTTGNYRQMAIQWSEPDIGSTITSYLVTANKEAHNIPSKADGASTDYRDVFNVTPGQTYTFKIQVRHNGTLYNVSSESECRAPIGVPPKWPEGIQPSPVVTDTQFTLNIDFFNNGTNGPITKRRLYMSLHKKMLEVADHQAGDMRAPSIGCCSGGFLENCRTGYCRTHLAPDTVYYYLAVVCTEKGCRNSPIFDFRTDKDNTTSVVVAMLVTSIIAAAIIIGAVLLWCSKKRNTNTSHSDVRDGRVVYRVHYRNNGNDSSTGDYFSPTVERHSPEYEELHVYEEVN
ncbi:uncharacterized protein LOC124277850 [Haliotis rubra]|uniref:uncharacterized protein LOC124277850 n=1 Tax=Haliotis rubra TaxID=36100 RepID=UPI001EE51C17|nr:uncharacterized protein LOC124277850 [Haliotis rubra]